MLVLDDECLVGDAHATSAPIHQAGHPSPQGVSHLERGGSLLQGLQALLDAQGTQERSLRHRAVCRRRSAAGGRKERDGTKRC